jgi:hypothetical protein
MPVAVISYLVILIVVDVIEIPMAAWEKRSALFLFREIFPRLISYYFVLAYWYPVWFLGIVPHGFLLLAGTLMETVFRQEPYPSDQKGFWEEILPFLFLSLPAYVMGIGSISHALSS